MWVCGWLDFAGFVARQTGLEEESYTCGSETNRVGG